ncbi:MAG: hypothetical protein Ta2A_27270 [Treponemataceae bacterium]|nr:MAG: hypothetical protein Ta2A_27270 [Treponemataceae bacterium]
MVVCRTHHPRMELRRKTGTVGLLTQELTTDLTDYTDRGERIVVNSKFGIAVRNHGTHAAKKAERAGVQVYARMTKEGSFFS